MKRFKRRSRVIETSPTIPKFREATTHNPLGYPPSFPFNIMHKGTDSKKTNKNVKKQTRDFFHHLISNQTSGRKVQLC